LTYENLELADIDSICPSKKNSLPDPLKYDKYYVNNSFVTVAAQGLNATMYESSELYRIIIKVTGENNVNLRFIIHDFVIYSSTGKIYLKNFNNHKEIIAQRAEDLYISMNNNNEIYYYTYGVFATEEYFPFQENKEDDIFISLIIQVISDNGSEKKEMKIKLTPITKSGLFQPLFW
jgi:hypothetical protein